MEKSCEDYDQTGKGLKILAWLIHPGDRKEKTQPQEYWKCWWTNQMFVFLLSGMFLKGEESVILSLGIVFSLAKSKIMDVINLERKLGSMKLGFGKVPQSYEKRFLLGISGIQTTTSIICAHYILVNGDMPNSSIPSNIKCNQINLSHCN